MNCESLIGSCTGTAEIDWLLCRMSAHDSYGASAAVTPCFDDPDDPGEDR